MRCEAEAGAMKRCCTPSNLIEHDDDDLRDLPLIDRKRRLARLIGRAKHAIRFTEHLTADGPTVFQDCWPPAGPACEET